MKNFLIIVKDINDLFMGVLVSGLFSVNENS